MEDSMSDSQSISHSSNVFIKEEVVFSDEECTEQGENDLDSFGELHSFQLTEPGKTCDLLSPHIVSPPCTQFFVKEERLSFDDTYTSIDQEKSITNRSQDFGLSNSNQFHRASEYQYMDFEQSLPHHVFIKEEIKYNDEVCNENMKELTYHKPPENNMFGSHFLAPCFEPQYQYANGQSAEGERSCLNETFPNLPLQKDTDTGQPRGSESFPHHSTIDDEDSRCQKDLNTDSHKESEMGRVKYCKLCSFSSRNINKLKLHLWGVHQKIIPAPFCCQYCLFQCRTKQSMQQHVFKKHNFGQEPIDCPYCKFQSLSILEVTNHIEVKHHKEKKYQYCPHCEYKNTNIGNVKYHIAARHTREMNFCCPICGYKCILSCDMRRHILKIHKKKIYNESLFRIVPIPNNVPDVI